MSTITEDPHRTSETQRFLSAVRRRALLVVLCTLVGGLVAFVLSQTQTTRYSAEASLLFRDPGFDQQLFGSSIFTTEDPQREAATNVQLVSLTAVASRTAADLDNGLTAGDVSAAIEIEPVGESNVVSITATAEDPEFAAELANSFAINYIRFRRDADRDKIADARRLVERNYNRLAPDEQAGEEGRQLQEQISRLRTLQALQSGNAEIVQRAEVPTTPSFPKTTRNTLLGLILGFIFGVAAAYSREHLDRRLREVSQLEETYSLPLLGSVPESRVLASEDGDGGILASFPEREAFRMVRTRLRYFNIDKQIQTVLVTSAASGDGKSTVAWNLAEAAASSGTSTVFLEVDLHHPVAGARYSLSPLPGLAEFLTHQASLDSITQTVSLDEAGSGPADRPRQLDVLVAGAAPPNPAELLESQEMARLLTDLATRYELIVIDTPPVPVLADAIPLIGLVDGVIVVAQLDKTTRDEALTLSDQLRKLDAAVLGVVINRAASPVGYGSYYYRAPAVR